MKGTPQGRDQFQHRGFILCLKYIMFSSIGILIPSLWVSQVQQQKPIICWDSLAQLWPTTQYRDFHAFFWVFGRWCLDLGRNIVSTNEKISFIVYIYTQSYSIF